LVVNVYIEGQRLDLFEDESISITSGVQDVKDISNLFADFSQSFNVPASKNNNAIFKNYYNQDINNGFDARTRKAGLININTIPFKTGKIQLNGVKIKDNVPASYNITFFGDAIKVKDLIGEDKLSDLEWLDNFNHDYSDVKVKEGLTTGIDFTVDGVSYPRAVIYPLISYARQFFYSSNPTVDTLDEAINIAYDASRDDGVRFGDLRPAIKLGAIIDAIEDKYGFNFVGSFFESQEFNEIYVNVNNSTESLANGLLVVDEHTSTIPERPDDFPFNLNSINTAYSVSVTPVDNTIGYKIRISFNGTVIAESQNWITGYSGSLQYSRQVDFGSDVTWKFEVITEEDFEFDARVDYQYSGNNQIVDPTHYPFTPTNLVIDLETLIRKQLKDIKVYKFLTSLFKTFNLVVTQSGDDILVEDLQSWYTQGEIIDITPYVDTKEKTVDRGVIFNQIEFSFEESEQILADEFNQTNNRIYGNEELTLYTDDTEQEELDGETLEIECIFENPIFERLNDIETGALTSIQYCPYFNREIKSISGNPFMFFAPSFDVSANTIGYKGIGTAPPEEISTSVIMPSHTQVLDFESFGLNFSAEFNEYTGDLNEDNIYTRYYADYIGDVFSNRRRNYKYKAILPLGILNSLKLNDRVVIRNTRYIINKMTSNLTKREDSLELINDIYDAPLASDLLNTSLFRVSNGSYVGLGGTYSIQYIGLPDVVIQTYDYGDGTDWMTIDSPSKTPSAISTITFTLDANPTYQSRLGGIQVLDGINNPIFTINQSAKIYKPSYRFSDGRNSQYIPLL
jgi:hypothetical protein